MTIRELEPIPQKLAKTAKFDTLKALNVIRTDLSVRANDSFNAFSVGEILVGLRTQRRQTNGWAIG